ncbi:MAG: hypothetical protein KA469_02620, partial [Phycisphaerae bacterium]|nr:hypothetical protein [Phycisphaerae bacterium]
MNPAFAESSPDEHGQETEVFAAENPPQTRQQLKQFLQVHLNLHIPDAHLCPGHSSPMDYLWYSWSTDWPSLRPAGQISGDCVVWANRGGGKTQIAAAAALLEGLFKENCRSRIIAGSLDQAGRM